MMLIADCALNGQRRAWWWPPCAGGDQEGGEGKAEADDDEGVGEGLDLGFPEGEEPDFFQGDGVSESRITTGCIGKGVTDAIDEVLSGGVAGGDVLGGADEVKIGPVIQEGGAECDADGSDTKNAFGSEFVIRTACRNGMEPVGVGRFEKSGAGSGKKGDWEHKGRPEPRD